MNKKGYVVVTFDSTHAALKAEKSLLALGIRIKAIPVPRKISSDCGIAIRFDDVLDVEEVRNVLLRSGISHAGVHFIEQP